MRLLRHPSRLLGVSLLLGLVTAGAATAQSLEDTLKRAFEGRTVTMRMDMPGSADGVDLRLEPATGLNFAEYRNDLRRYGPALRAGEQSTVTLIKVKGDLIEFQIGGGGFGTFGDDTGTSSGINMLDKSEREKTLERQIRDENDRDRRRTMERELDALRDRRERENRRLEAQSRQIEEIKRDRIARQRLISGSRFNLRWAKKVPPTLTAQDLEAALVEYVDFRNETGREARGVDLNLLRKGLSQPEVERMFGRPSEQSETRARGVVTTTLLFDRDDYSITADFVEGLLTHFVVTSR